MADRLHLWVCFSWPAIEGATLALTNLYPLHVEIKEARLRHLYVVTGAERLALPREFVSRAQYDYYFAWAMSPPSFIFAVFVACRPGAGHLAPPVNLSLCAIRFSSCSSC